MILLMGIAPFGLELAASFVHVLMNNGLKMYGDDLAIGAFTVITSIAQIMVLAKGDRLL